MTGDLDFSSIPHVLDDLDVPFVLGFAADSRRALAVGGAEYRRGTDRYTIEWPFGDVRLRAQVTLAEGDCYLFAHLGELLNDWWPLIQSDTETAVRPFLSAGAAGRYVTMTSDNVPVNVIINPPGHGFNATQAVALIGRGLTDENMRMAHYVSLGVIKAALLVIVEYRTLLNPIPDINANTGEVTLALATMLDVAAEVAQAINWEPAAT